MTLNDEVYELRDKIDSSLELNQKEINIKLIYFILELSDEIYELKRRVEYIESKQNGWVDPYGS